MKNFWRTEKEVRWRGRRTATLLTAVGVLLAVSPGASAAILSVNNTLYSDGTAGFDSTAGNGFDTGPNNQIVRTNDTFTYNVSLTTSGVESGIVVKSVLPQVGGKTVATWPAVPGFCIAGSSISADGLTLTCTLGPIGTTGTNTATDLLLPALVKSTTANGTQIPAPTITITAQSGSVPPSVSTPKTVTVSAAPFYDIVIQGSYQGNPKFYGYSTASGPANQDGFFSRPLIGIVAKNPNGFGNKGVEQLDPTKPINLSVELSGMPAGTILDNYHTGTAPYGTPAATQDFQDGCGSPGIWPNTYAQSPSGESGDAINMYSFVGDYGPTASTASNVVPNGGTCTVTGTTSTTVNMAINGTDTTLVRHPDTVSGTGSPVPATDWWVANKALVLWTPLTSYPVNVDVNNTIKLGSLSGTSISGQTMQNISTTNDSVSYVIRTYNDGSAQKHYTDDWLRTGAPYSTTCDPANTADCDVNFMSPNQLVTSEVRYANRGPITQNNVYVCEIIDRTVFDLSPNFRATVTFGTGTIQYGARAAGAGPYFSSNDSANLSDLRNFGVTGGTSAYSSARCDDSTIRWYNTVTEAEAAGGLVYVRGFFPTVLGNTQAFVGVQGLKLRSTYAANITTQYPTTVVHKAGDPIAADTLIRNVARVWGTGVNWVDNATLNDHLQVIPMKTTSRVSKDIVAVNGSANTNPVNVSPDSVLTYQLQPRYSTTFPPQPGTFTVTDILPPNVTYVAGSATLGGAAKEPQVIANDPTSGYTRLVWTYTNVSPYVGPDGSAANLPVIRFNAKLGSLIPNNSKIVNAVAVTAGSSDYDADCTYSTTTMNFGTCVKSASNSVTVQTTAGYRLQKTTPITTIEPGQPFSFQIGYASFGKTLSSTDIPDMIDILPYTSDGTARTNFMGRTPQSTFNTGAYQLSSVTPPSNDPSMVIYYTVANPTTIDNDPRAASNTIPGGTTKWCTTSQFGTAGCPTSMTQVTAIRLHPSVTSFPADTVYTATVNLQSTGTAMAGNLFNNSVGSRSLSGSLLLLEVQANSPVRVVSSSLSGQVFVDANQNGTLDAGTDAPIANTCIRVTGTLSGGTTVTYSMRTKADGTYAFTSGATGVFNTADCTGTAISTFVGLLSGTYTISEIQPAGYADGTDYAGNLGGTVSNDSISGIVLGVNQSGTGYVFTELPVALTLSKAVNPAFVKVTADTINNTNLTYVPSDRKLTYTLTVRNPSNVAISDVKLTDALPAGVTFVNATLDGAPLTPSSTSPLTLTLSSLAANTTKDVLVTVTINPVTPNTNQSAILNTASLQAPGVSTVNSQQVRTDFIYTTLFKQVRNVSQNGTWNGTSTGRPKDVLEYCIDFHNYGTTPLLNYQILDAVPAQTTYVANSAKLLQGTMTSPGGSFPTGSAGYASATNAVVASGITLNPGDTGTLCFGATIK